MDLIYSTFMEAGTDEAGRGCLAGPVTAAAVILPQDFFDKDLNDSKQMTEKQRDRLRILIEKEAISWGVAHISNQKIDELNILKASIFGMHEALNKLSPPPPFIIVDGNKFLPYRNIPYKTIVKGDALYLRIAAASVLAKTHRDELMSQLDAQFPQYGWAQNKGYPTKKHRQAIAKYGVTPYHRITFQLLPQQDGVIDFGDF